MQGHSPNKKNCLTDILTIVAVRLYEIDKPIVKMIR